MLAARRCKIYITWWWSETVPRVSRFCNYGYSWMPTSLPWNPRILWRIKYESWTTGSSPSGWEASSKWGHGGRKECKAWTLKALSVRGNFLSLVYHKVLIVVRAIITYQKLEDSACRRNRQLPPYEFPLGFLLLNSCSSVLLRCLYV